jgi:hypothetical protein
MTFGKVMYLVVSVFDSVYRFVWLEEDHPGSSYVKATSSMPLYTRPVHQASLMDAKHASNCEVQVAATVSDGNTGRLIQHIPGDQEAAVSFVYFVRETASSGCTGATW